MSNDTRKITLPDLDDLDEVTEEITEEKAQEVFDEIIEGSRIFEAQGFGHVKIRFPTNAEKRRADIEYSKAFSELLDTGIKTNKEMEKILRDRGIWGDEEERLVSETELEINKNLLLLKKAKTKKRKEELRKTLSDLRQKLFDLQQQKQSFFQQTVESKAEEARFGYFLYCCTSNAETNKPLWKTFEEFQEEENQAGVLDITYQFMTFVRGLPADFLEHLPEDAFDEDEESEE